MSSRFTRNLSEVKDVNKLAEHVTTQNDLVQTTEGDVFVVTKNGFQKITGGLEQSDLDPVIADVNKNKSEITSVKSEQTKLKNRVTDLETFKDEQDTKNGELDTTIEDLIARVEDLETINVTGVKLDKSTLSLEEGATATLNATVEPSNATYKDVKFTSSDDAIATVDNDGLVTGVKEGTADITVESLENGSITAKCTLTVTETPPEEDTTT